MDYDNARHNNENIFENWRRFSSENLEICLNFWITFVFCLYIRWDLFWNRLLIQNGVALNATWVSIATLLSLASVTTYWAGVNQSTACTIVLSILTCEVLCYFILENFIFERYLRYTFTVWPVFIWALTASLLNNWDPSNANSIITAVLLALSSALYIIKIGLSIWRARTKPL